MRTERGGEEEVRPRTTRTCEGGMVRASEMEGKGERKDRLDVVRGHASARGRLGQGEGVQARVHGMDGSEAGASGPFVPWFFGTSSPALLHTQSPTQERRNSLRPGLVRVRWTGRRSTRPTPSDAAEEYSHLAGSVPPRVPHVRGRGVGKSRIQVHEPTDHEHNDRWRRWKVDTNRHTRPSIRRSGEEKEGRKANTKELWIHRRKGWRKKRTRRKPAVERRSSKQHRVDRTVEKERKTYLPRRKTLHVHCIKRSW